MKNILPYLLFVLATSLSVGVSGQEDVRPGMQWEGSMLSGFSMLKQEVNNEILPSRGVNTRFEVKANTLRSTIGFGSMYKTFEMEGVQKSHVALFISYEKSLMESKTYDIRFLSWGAPVFVAINQPTKANVNAGAGMAAYINAGAGKLILRTDLSYVAFNDVDDFGSMIVGYLKPETKIIAKSFFIGYSLPL